MKIEVNLTKTRFFVLLGAILILGGIFAVYAFGGSQPSVVGHSVGEIDWSQPIQGPVTISNTGDESVLLNLQLERNWEIRQEGAGATSALKFVSPGGKNFLIDTTGNVGIGTTAPTAKLDVNGNVNVSGNIQASGNVSANGLKIGGSRTITYVSGSGVSCPSGTSVFLRNLAARTCGVAAAGLPHYCTTISGWSGTTPTCYYQTSIDYSIILCQANSWTEALCIG